MTLVIATVQIDNISLLADTAISFDTKLGREPYHALKALALSGTTVIAFSGNHERSIGIFFELHGMRASDLGMLELATLVAQLRENDLSPSLGSDVPDFLIARTTPELALYRINDQGINECTQQGWIGNSQAAAFVSRNIVDHDCRSADNAFQRVVSEKAFIDAGGHVVAIRGDKFGFRFIPYLRLTSPGYIPVDGWNTVDFGNAQTGGYGFTTITPREFGNNGYGVFFFQGAFGLFFHVNASKRISETLKAYAATPEAFIKILEAEVGYALEYCGSLT